MKHGRSSQSPASHGAPQRMEEDGDNVEEMGDLWYLRRLDGGLFTLQTVDYILAWIVMEDDGVCLSVETSLPTMLKCTLQVREHVRKLLDRKNQSFKDLVKTLQIYHDNVDEDNTANVDSALSKREILHNLIAFLDAC